MPQWNSEYYESLAERFFSMADGLNDRLDAVVEGRTAPAVEDIPIGSARKLRAAVLFFDIRGFTNRTASADMDKLKEALFMLDCVIPTVEHVVHDHGGYVEKNTGDGIMAIVGAGSDDATAANAALDIATTSFYVLQNLVNGYLASVGIPMVEARIGVDMGTVLLARVGTPRGSAKQARSFLTAVGPTANLASRLQREMAGTNEIWTGDLIKRNASEHRQRFFTDRTPDQWSWSYVGSGDEYRIWHYHAVRVDPE